MGTVTPEALEAMLACRDQAGDLVSPFTVLATLLFAMPLAMAVAREPPMGLTSDAAFLPMVGYTLKLAVKQLFKVTNETCVMELYSTAPELDESTK